MKTTLRGLTCVASACLFAAASFAQSSAAASTSSSASTSSTLLTGRGLPSAVRRYLLVFGDRIQKPGHERTTMQGTLTDRSGRSGGATLTWEAPGNVRLDRTGASARALVVQHNKGLVDAATVSTDDSDLLESLSDDTAEAFFFSFQGGASHRLLGEHFRADDGKTVDYQGPWYDIYELVMPARAQSTGPARQKFYYFDSQTGLLNHVAYSVGGVRISTEIGAWTKRDGQSFPGKVVRRENGVVVGSFDIGAAATQPAAADSTFSGQER